MILNNELIAHQKRARAYLNDAHTQPTLTERSERIIAELWRAKRAYGAPWVSKSTHPRKFGNHVTVHRPPAARPSAPQAYQCLLSHFLAALGTQRKLIAHQCCHQLTAVKTGYPLTSIT